MAWRARALERLSLHEVRLTPRGTAFLAVGILALFIAYGAGQPGLQYVGLLLVALPLVAVGLVRIRRPRFEVGRVFIPAIVQAGSHTSARLSVHNRARTVSSRVLWRDHLPWAPWATEPRDLLPLRPSRQPVELGYELRAPRRGIFGVGPFAVTLGDPFGLSTSEVEFGGTHELIVTPEVVPLAESGLAYPDESGRARSQRRTSGDEDDSITREYRSGNAMRRVHWRTTARYDELMVRQEEPRSLPRARILIDTMRSGYLDVGDDESEAFEWVVRMLASVAVHLRRAGYAVSVEESADQQLHGQRRPTWDDQEFLGALAGLELRDRRNETQRVLRHGGPLIALGGSPDSHTIEWMLRQRPPGSLAVAFLVRELTSLDRSFGVSAATGSSGERLVDDGWLVVPVRADDDHAAAWNAVMFETERARGSA